MGNTEMMFKTKVEELAFDNLSKGSSQLSELSGSMLGGHIRRR
jgi:hypothetical protein